MRFHRQQIISCIVLTASVLLCELFIKNAELKVGSMAFINLVFICIYYPKRTKETIILFVIFILLMTYFSAKVLSYNPHLGGYVFLPIALFTIYKSKKNIVC